MPQECFISVRVGETQKLSRLAAGRVYRFPEAGDRRFGKIEVFRRIGMCSVDVDLHNEAARDVTVNCQDEGFGHLKLKIGVDQSGRKASADQSALGGGGQQNPTSPRGAVKPEGAKVRAAKDYLNKHGLEVKLSEAMQALLRDRPENPHEYLASKLLGGKQLPPLANAPSMNSSTKDPLSSQTLKQHNRLSPLALQVMGPGYYTQHFRQMPKGAWSAMHAQFPARAVAKQVSSRGGCAIVPFKAYHTANFAAMPKAAWATAYALFPKKAGGQGAGSKAKVPVSALLPFPAYYGANTLHAPAECWAKLFSKFPAKGAPSTTAVEDPGVKLKKFNHSPSVGTWLARRLNPGGSSGAKAPSARERPAVSDVLPFKAYYEANIIEAPRSMFDSLSKKFPVAKGAPAKAAAGEDKPKGPIWTQKPSIGTWLARPQGLKQVTPSFPFLPSVGTWMSPKFYGQ